SSPRQEPSLLIGPVDPHPQRSTLLAPTGDLALDAVDRDHGIIPGHADVGGGAFAAGRTQLRAGAESVVGDGHDAPPLPDSGEDTGEAPTLESRNEPVKATLLCSSGRARTCCRIAIQHVFRGFLSRNTSLDRTEEQVTGEASPVFR